VFALHVLFDVDINECHLGIAANCSYYAECLNSGGSYECQCMLGTIGDGQVCRGKLNRCNTRFSTLFCSGYVFFTF